MARRVEFTKAGSPSTIRVADMPMPEPKLGQVRVKVAFAGINFADLLMRLGSINLAHLTRLHPVTK